MFKEGQMVETLNGLHRGSVLEVDGDTVYIEQSNGVEIDFPASELQEYVNPIEKKKLSIFLEQLSLVKKEGFSWEGLNTREEFAKTALSEQVGILDDLKHLSNPAYYVPLVRMMNECQSSQEKMTFEEVSIQEATCVQKVNTLLFLGDFKSLCKVWKQKTELSICLELE